MELSPADQEREVHETYHPQALNPALIESPSAAITPGDQVAAEACPGKTRQADETMAAPVTRVTVLRTMAPPLRDHYLARVYHREAGS
ncbi:hypothetical protein GCM10023259_044550 [Thermocatellispora tengchongensis]